MQECWFTRMLIAVGEVAHKINNYFTQNVYKFKINCYLWNIDSFEKNFITRYIYFYKLYIVFVNLLVREIFLFNLCKICFN